MSFPDPSRPVPYVQGPAQPPPQQPQMPPFQPPQQYVAGQPVAKGSPVTVVVILAVVVLLICGGAAVYGIATSNDPPKRQAAMNQATADGDLEFMVTNASCNNARVGTELLGKNAQGQFCLVTVSVKNQGNSAHTFNPARQRAHVLGGDKVNPDVGAGIYVTGGGAVEINPGNQVDEVLVFDISKTAKLVDVELHASAGSDGVLVELHW